MTRDDIIRMAREAGIIHPEMVDKTLERFAALVAAAERERVMQVVQSMKADLEARFEKSYMEGVVAGAAAERERLAQPVQEPVAWGMRDMNGHIYDCISVEEHGRAEGDYNVPLYTTPPRREWVGLTDEEMHECWDSPLTPLGMKHVRAIEAKLKEKNS